MYFILEILKDSHIVVCTVSVLDDYYETVMQCCFAITEMNVLFFVQWIEINEKFPGTIDEELMNIQILSKWQCSAIL